MLPCVTAGNWALLEGLGGVFFATKICDCRMQNMSFGVAAGNWVLLEGLDATITKTATLVPEFLDEEVHIMRPLQFHTQVLNLQLDIPACCSFHKTSRSTSTERCGGTPRYHAGGFGQTHVVLLAFVSSPNVLGLHLLTTSDLRAERGKDCGGAAEPAGAAQDGGGAALHQQELPAGDHQGGGVGRARHPGHRRAVPRLPHEGATLFTSSTSHAPVKNAWRRRP